MSDKQLLEQIAMRARTFRRDRGLTQEDMQNFGFAPRYYQRIEAATQNISMTTLNRLARAFRVQPAELLR